MPFPRQNPARWIFILGILTLAAVLMSSSASAKSFAISAPDQNIVVLGDSITADGRYAQIMQTLIDQQHPDLRVRVLPRGASGDTVKRALERLETDVVPWRPSWVLINLGINDSGQFSTEQFLYFYEAMINRIQRDTGARIGIISPIFPDNDGNHSKLDAFVAGLRTLSAKYGCLYIPCYEAFAAARPTLPKGVKYSPDGVHPNHLGYWIFGITIMDALGYSFNTPISVELPVTRTCTWNAPEAATLPGTTFTLDLATKLQVKLTAFVPQQATAMRAAKPVAVDGKLDEWNLDKPLLLNRPEQLCGGATSWLREPPQNKAWFSYDERGLTFAFAVDTPVLMHTPEAAKGVERDCVELMLDLRTPAEKAAAKSPMYLQEGYPHICQYVFAPATKDVPQCTTMVGSGDKSMLGDVELASAVTATGYIIEGRIPAKHFPNGKIETGSSVGLDFTVNDVDRFARSTQVQQMRWSGSQMSFFCTLEFGQLLLEK